jgi:hypothetical protein
VVRAAALEMMAAVAQEEALPHLARSLGDPSPLVRRRAAVLLGFARGEVAETALCGALRDADPGVARAARAALCGRSSEQTQRALEKYQRTAPLPRAVAAPRVPTAARSAVPVAAAASPRPMAAPARPAMAAMPAAPTRVATPAPRTRVAVLEARAVAVAPAVAPAPGAGPGALEAALLLELRGALRGLPADELARVCAAPPARVEAALEVLAGRGAVLRRGPRWCMA